MVTAKYNFFEIELVNSMVARQAEVGMAGKIKSQLSQRAKVKR